MKLGVNESTVHNWETNRTAPRTRLIPRIIALLGFDPYPAPQMLGEQLVSIRR